MLNRVLQAPFTTVLPVRNQKIKNHGKILKFGANKLPEGNKVMIVTDAWNHINGVVTTVENTAKNLTRAGYEVKIIHPQLFPYLSSEKFGADLALPFSLSKQTQNAKAPETSDMIPIRASSHDHSTPSTLRQRLHHLRRNWPVPGDQKISGLEVTLLKEQVASEIETFQPDRMFIVTEGSLGWAARNYCVKNQIPFSTNYTTKWPEYLWTHLRFPERITYAAMRKFHNAAASVLVTTRSLLDDLSGKGFKNLKLWARAVDTEKFHLMPPEARQEFLEQQGLGSLKPPFYLYTGRVSKEKNLDVFLEMKLPGTKIVVGPSGGGYTLEELREKYPDIVFPGPKKGQELANFYAASDVFVFPSKTDTFGLVILEALASGLPVVAFDVTGPKDVIDKDSKVGYLAQSDEELHQFALQAWRDLQEKRITKEQCRAYTQPFSWDEAVKKLIEYLPLVRWNQKEKHVA